MHVVETRELTKAYRSQLGRRKPPALDALTLAIEENEIFGFLGKNGAGKTTTIKILCGLLRPTHGSAHIRGLDVRLPASRSLIGYLPENPYFYEYLTPRETLDFYGQLQGLTRAERHTEWDKLSDMLDLRHLANQRVRDFSKGMRQRLGFAVALVGDPSILILDEPLSGLDPLGRRDVRELMLLMRELKKTIFFSSHVLSDVEQICQRVGILSSGRLVVQGCISKLLKKRIHQVEVIGQDVPQATLERLRAMASSTRVSEDGSHFVLDTLHDANAAARMVIETGGRLVEFTPIRESLEDYFMREQTVVDRATASSDARTRGEVGKRPQESAP